MNSILNEQTLTDKLSKLNTTQQCIETLSHWCIFHQDKAELVVTTWGKQFHSSEMTKKVPLLYLANDILQNSKRKGNEFVIEFWKVLPAALKEIVGKDDEHGKNVVSRLVKIWEERKVFGSQTHSLKDVMLGEELPPPLELGKKRSRSVKIVKRDTRSIRTKLTVGGTAEKIVSALHLVVSEHSTEDEEMSKCKSAVHHVRKMEKDVDMALARAKHPMRKTLSKELEEEERMLKQSIEKLKVVETNRLALVSQLREALTEQESELENVRTQIQVAEAQAGEASNMRKYLDDEDYVGERKPLGTTTSPDIYGKAGETSKKTAAAIAAEVADKLTASSSSQYIMSSVLSTFAAEAAKSAGLAKPSSYLTTNSYISQPENALSDSNALMSAQLPNPPPSNPYQSMLAPHPTVHQGQYHSLANPTSQQYLQPSAGMMSPYSYGSIAALPSVPPPPPPPAPPSYMTMTQQPLSMMQQGAAAQQQQPPLPQQPPPPNFRPVTPVQPPGMLYYSQPYHSQQ
ncbi:regulation of nuclear pre-mRNA domain-containing protein 1B-like [Solanum pennellii]|uniref:Regulation of nuclear pre-mRNA domain-containing protein 1B-like n=1 Tax=Solanum pennellii TaxID=28526 RepID=A0ABM1GJ35_SOLPN|nr:regulation of nuclear pre-mRNA domain-containing protein 1B-like [Solanum pennellii]